jgi:hypothetical protein
LEVPNLKRLRNGGKKATFKMDEHFTEENVWGKMAKRKRDVSYSP